MNTADLITSFFNNELSPDQERQFLLSVASSDSLRLGLKSHVMLDKILSEEVGNSRISPNVRAKVMQEAALMASAAGGLATGDAFAREQEVSAEETAAADQAKSSLWHRFSGWAAAPLVLLFSVGSFFAGFYMNEGDDEVNLNGLASPIEETYSPVLEADPASLAPVKSEEIKTSSSTDMSEKSASSVEPRQEVPTTVATRSSTSRPTAQKRTEATTTAVLDKTKDDDAQKNADANAKDGSGDGGPHSVGLGGLTITKRDSSDKDSGAVDPK